MSTYLTHYQENHDIDWFFSYKGRYFHVASNGGKIPRVIDSYVNRTVQHLLEHETIRNGYRQIASNPEKLDYSTFYEYAEKGFISIDRFDGCYEEQSYYVVAIPNNNGLPPINITILIPELNPFEEGLNIIGINRFLEE